MIRNRQGQNIQPDKYEFLDEAGRAIRLSEYFKPKKPVFIAPVYYECSGVCTVTLNQLFSDLKRLGFYPGEALQVVVFSINPKETPTLANEKKKTYVSRFKYQEFENGFHFLTGTQAEIDKLTSVLGFQYEKTQDGYLHPSAYYVMTPEGIITKVMSGKKTKTKRLREVIFEAANGRKLSTFEKMVLSCQPKEKK